MTGRKMGDETDWQVQAEEALLGLAAAWKALSRATRAHRDMTAVPLAAAAVSLCGMSQALSEATGGAIAAFPEPTGILASLSREQLQRVEEILEVVQ